MCKSSLDCLRLHWIYNTGCVIGSHGYKSLMIRASMYLYWWVAQRVLLFWFGCYLVGCWLQYMIVGLLCMPCGALQVCQIFIQVFSGDGYKGYLIKLLWSYLRKIPIKVYSLSCICRQVAVVFRGSTRLARIVVTSHAWAAVFLSLYYQSDMCAGQLLGSLTGMRPRFRLELELKAGVGGPLNCLHCLQYARN